jgi:transcription factor E2F7/8
MSSLASRDSDSKTPSFYSRKEKSLGVLCSNFFKLYNQDGVDTIGLDNAALRLGVERRRIYDIVNILESVGVLKRKAKNMYSWKGFGAIAQALDELMASTGNENPCNSNTASQEKSLSSSKPDNRKEKSLGLLTQNFIKLFLSSTSDLISLDSAATALLGDQHDPTAMRTKVRRLYDIANVFSSMNLIQKTRHPDSGKPAFRWLGLKEDGKIGLDTSSESSESKRRVFGTDITNMDSKRSKVESSDWKFKEKISNVEKKGDLKDKCGENLMKQTGSKDFVFGPFSPANVPKSTGSADKNPKQVQDWENLASAYRPQYRNPVLCDLFGHYACAWKSWHDEVGKKKQHLHSQV